MDDLEKRLELLEEIHSEKPILQLCSTPELIKLYNFAVKERLDQLTSEEKAERRQMILTINSRTEQPKEEI